ncbi:MAG: hypothetical protein KF681_10030 [Bdellovibrionaceae bacterium]|nr:hypothetical protein [Pseudobdellovibrionaceae bacterium]
MCCPFVAVLSSFSEPLILPYIKNGNDVDGANQAGFIARTWCWQQILCCFFSTLQNFDGTWIAKPGELSGEKQVLVLFLTNSRKPLPVLVFKAIVFSEIAPEIRQSAVRSQIQSYTFELPLEFADFKTHAT